MSCPGSELACTRSPALAALLRESLQPLVPPPPIGMVEWAETQRYLPTGRSAMSGAFSWAVTPYLRGIAEAFDDPAISRIACQKSAQVGWTDGVINNALGWVIDAAPTSVIAMFPREASAKDFNREKFEPMIESSGDLAEKVDRRSRSSESTQLYKGFIGGFVKFIGSNSTAGVKSTSARIGIVEEPDDCNLNIRGQGDSIALLEERTKTFPDAKLLVGGTPSVKGLSSIEDEMRNSDQRRFYVPCHECGDAAPLAWDHVHWQQADTPWHEIYGKHLPDTARYACPGCGSLWDDRARLANIQRGDWRATAEFRGTAGFYLNELYSPFPASTMPKLVEKFLAADYELKAGNQGAMIAFWNSTLGQAWEMQSDAPEEDTLRQRAEDYEPMTCPQGGLIASAGVDVQWGREARLAVVITVWGRREESWVVDWLEIPGNPLKPEVWERLDEVLAQPVTVGNGAQIHVQAVSVDSSDGTTADDVYDYVRSRNKRGGRKFMAIKGSSQAGREVFSRPAQSVDVNRKGKADKHGLKPYMVGVERAKDLVYARLKLTGYGPGRIHWFRGIRDDWYEQLLSEVKFPGRGGKNRWQLKAGRRNEALDAYVYSMHAGRALRVHTMSEQAWDVLEERLVQGDLLGPPQPPASAPSERQQSPHRAAAEAASEPEPAGFGSPDWQL